jgi:Kef-type K+ transport system membrane component KefB
VAVAALLLLDLALIVVVVRCGGALAVRCGQPRIAGQIVGAIVVGPTALGGQIDGVVDGAVASGLVGSVFPGAVVDALSLLGALGMILYMLLVGLTIDPLPMRRRVGPILAMSIGVIVSMALLALVAAPYLESDGGWKASGVTSLAFLLALVAGLAAQGVPIAALILEERRMLTSEIGAIAIATGACVVTVALIVSGVAIQGGDAGALEHLLLIVGIAAVVVAIAAPLGRSRWVRLPPRVAVGVLLAIALASGIAGKGLIGTVLIGPLIVGIAVRNAGFSAVFLEEHLGAVVRGVLLPVFLGVAALHTNLRELRVEMLLPVAGLIAAVVLLKLGGATASARAVGLDRGQARVMGAMLQCGGVMTIAVSLDVLQAGIITTRTHAMLTLVGIVTTVTAGPLLARSGLGAVADGGPARDAGRPALG